MDSWNGKPIHQVNHTLITSSPTDLGGRWVGWGWGRCVSFSDLNSKWRNANVSRTRVGLILGYNCPLKSVDHSSHRLRHHGDSRRFATCSHFGRVHPRDAKLLQRSLIASLPEESLSSHMRRGGSLNIDHHILICICIMTGANQCQSPRSQQVNQPPPPH